MAEGFTDKGVTTQEPSTKPRSAERPKEKRPVREVEAVPSITKKAPEEISRPLERTTVRIATREATKDRVLKPPERTTTETVKREGSEPPESTTAATVPTRATQGSSTTRELPPDSGDVTGSGSPIYVNQPPMLARQPSKKDSPKPSTQDGHQGGEGVPTRDVQIPPSLPPPSPPTTGRNEHPSRGVTQAVGGRITDEFPSRPPFRMYPAFPSLPV